MNNRLLLALSAFLGLFSFLTVLAFHHLADGDMWAKLILGASVWLNGSLLKQDIFAFTPILPVYVDHEWGAGFIFYAFLNFFGPTSLMLLKMFLATASLVIAACVAKKRNCGPGALLLLALPCAFCLLPAYVPVIRSHAFTFFFFALTLFCLEEIQRGKKWPIYLQILIVIIWTNVHGGFVAGLGTIGVYAAAAIIRRQNVRSMIVLTIVSCAVTAINPYGIHFWGTIIPAVLQQRPNIPEWGPMPIFAMDAFVGFRILFVVAVFTLLAGWHKRGRESWAGLAMLAITAFISFRSKRHAPFFAVACLAFLGNYFEYAMQKIANCNGRKFRWIRPAAGILILYAIVSVFVAKRFLPEASLQVLAPIRAYPVREVDILSNAGVSGNLVVPFEWGSYASWRLYPKIKVSIDGRYETTYPEETLQTNLAFAFKTGPNWADLIRTYQIDFIILDLERGRVSASDLQLLGFSEVWIDEKHSGLFARNEHLALLRKVAMELPATTIEPLDPNIPRRSWFSAEAKNLSADVKN